MFLLIGFAFDMVIATVLYLPLILIWTFYLAKKKPSKSVAITGTILLCAVYFSFAIFLFCWQCWDQDEIKGLHKIPGNSGTVELIL